ncbi:hypothetical protein RHMOL_Rhmol02G0157200 [Rhododendron molle]|uniref:Uncharacterized protein n=1 Tax=Rhododendron molle TaxID=49168 RepID=A0ACC0PQY4_RHOML|nr:hypothetical protein RHMOL_Rhmol02G0157200 [Rhododendron molle]
MAILGLCDKNNKENIPPPLSKKGNTIGALSPVPTKKRRRTSRNPLEDITNLFLPSLIRSTPISNTAALSVSRCSSVCNSTHHRKRRPQIGPEMPMQMNKAFVSPRTYFR